jgi:hypothetical protein
MYFQHDPDPRFDMVQLCSAHQPSQIWYWSLEQPIQAWLAAEDFVVASPTIVVVDRSTTAESVCSRSSRQLDSTLAGFLNPSRLDCQALRHVSMERTKGASVLIRQAVIIFMSSEL